MNVQHQERAKCQHKFPPKLIETEKPVSSIKMQQTALIRVCEAK